MTSTESPVTLILDETYGLRARDDAKRGAVWLIKSPENIEAAKELRRKVQGRSDNISLFDSFGESAEQACLDIIPVIDLHHPELSELFVVGVALSPKLRKVLEKRINQETVTGFVLGQSADPYGKLNS